MFVCGLTVLAIVHQTNTGGKADPVLPFSGSAGHSHSPPVSGEAGKASLRKG